MSFPIEPKTVFYDYLYVLALTQNPEIAEQVLAYYCYTDVEFNHKKQFASQARSCAIYKYLVDNNNLSDYIQDVNKFISIYGDIIVPHQSSLPI